MTAYITNPSVSGLEIIKYLSHYFYFQQASGLKNILKMDGILRVQYHYLLYLEHIHSWNMKEVLNQLFVVEWKEAQKQ